VFLKNKVVFGILSVVGIVGLGWLVFINMYAPYVPMVYVERIGYVEKPSLNTPEHRRNVKIVLEYENAPRRFEKSRILIPYSLQFGFANRELIYNYTLKANDTEFIKNAKKVLAAEN
jgi:hypothetical protein